MLGIRCLVGTATVTLLAMVQGGMVPVPSGEIDKVHIRLESIREKCLVEDLPEKTVVLGTNSSPSSSASSLPLQLNIQQQVGRAIIMDVSTHHFNCSSLSV